MKRALIAAAAVALLLGGWCVARGLFADDEAAIRAAIEDMRQAAEAKDVQRFMRHISSDYQDDSGHSAFIIGRMVDMALSPMDSVKVHIDGVQVMVTGDSAYATLSVFVEATRRGQLTNPFGTEQAPERPRLTLKKDGSDWEVVKVDGVEGNFGE